MQRKRVTKAAQVRADIAQAAMESIATSVGLLGAARSIQEQRAQEYEQEGGERSAGKMAAAFNAITGRDLMESEVMLMLLILKLVRGQSKKAPHFDSVLDGVSYAALFGEARLAGR